MVRVTLIESPGKPMGFPRIYPTLGLFLAEGGEFGERPGKTSPFGTDSFGRAYSGHWVWEIWG